MAFQFSQLPKRKRSRRKRKPQSVGLPDIPLIGMVGAKPASEEEERITSALQKNSNVTGFIFQWAVPTEKSLPLEDKIVDWLVFSRGKRIPLEFFGRIGHGISIIQEANDINRINELNQTFAQIRVQPLRPDENILYWWQNPGNEQAIWDRIIRQLF